MMRPPILLNDLKRHNRQLLGEFTGDFERVNSRGWYILGPEVEAFEEEFASYLGISYCRGLANGTDALELAILACGVRPGDHVATTANAGMYSTTAIKKVNAVPVFIEIEPHRMTMSPEALEKALTAEVRAVIVTHLYGQMADMVSLTMITNSGRNPTDRRLRSSTWSRIPGKARRDVGRDWLF